VAILGMSLPNHSCELGLLFSESHFYWNVYLLPRPLHLEREEFRQN
jgi:hypothetical protein